jgi:4-hydroxy-tetrahydrodipicolinate synthase
MTIGRHVTKFSGYAAALPTPFDDNDFICEDAFERLCLLQIENGATALVVGGITGEAPNLSSAEHARLVKIAVRVSSRQVPVIADAGSNATAHAIELAKDAEVNGADAVLSVVPYYNKPMQEGLYDHFREIADSTTLPIILHDEPSRTGRGLADETVARLAQIPQVIGLNDVTGDVSRAARLRPLVGHNFRLLSGDDATAFGFIVQGGDGCISATSNLAPGICRDMFLAWRQGSPLRAKKLAQALAKLNTALFLETNPVALKYALSLFGLASPKVRLPLVELSEQAKAAIANVLIAFCDSHSVSLIGKIVGAPIRIRRRA